MNYLYLAVGGGLIIAIIFVLYIIKEYNRLIALRIKVERQAAHLEAHLKEKYDLIPALIDAVKGYAKHEKSTLEEVTRLRSQWANMKDIAKKIKISNQLDSLISKLLVLHEKYPNLKADKNFMYLQKKITMVEGSILHERKVYNKRVSWYDMRVEQFPSNIVAKIFGFKEMPFFSMNEEMVYEK